MATWVWVTDRWNFATLVLVSHHCLLRPEEARELRPCDFALFDDNVVRRDQGYGLVRTSTPKRIG